MRKINLKTKIIIISIISLILIIFGLFITRKILSSKKTSSTIYKVREEVYENTIEIAGTVSAAQEQKLQALGIGTVLGVYVKKGDVLKKGDLILQLDDQEQEYNLANLDYKMTSTRISGSAKELELMEKQRLSLVQKIADRKVIATFDGVIADLDVSVGDSLEAKDFIGTLVNLDYLTAEVEIPETDVTKLKVGQKVEFKFPAYSEPVEGYVVSWPAIGTITNRGATVVKAKLRIDDYPKEILPNFSFTGKIQISQPETNLVVERYAIGYDNGKPFVQLENSKEKTYVKIIPYGNNFVKIIEGLTGGENLIGQSKPLPSGMNRNRPKTATMPTGKMPPR